MHTFLQTLIQRNSLALGPVIAPVMGMFLAMGGLAAPASTAWANSPNPPRNIRVIPGSAGPCLQTLLKEANESVEQLMGDFKLSESEAVLVYSAEVAGQIDFSDTDYLNKEQILRASFDQLDALFNGQTDLVDPMMTIARDMGFSLSTSKALAQLQWFSRNGSPEESERAKAIIHDLDARIIDLQAQVLGCSSK